jgi:hypothetical protein
MSEQNIDDHVDLQIQYRLKWDMVALEQIHRLESKYGRDVWERMKPEDLEKLTWTSSERVSFDLADLADQRATLDLWAITGSQPIRNVEFSRRATLAAGEWEPV